jgi:hypothetical protein
MLSKTIVAMAAFAVAAILVTAPPHAFAQGSGQTKSSDSKWQQGTEQENAACRRDTRRLCRHVKADEGSNAFLTCLQANRAKLSKACKDVLESHGL